MVTADRAATSGLTINKWLPRRLFDRFVTRLLRSRFHGLAGASGFGMLLTYTGRRSGRRYTLPLAYTRAGDTVTTIALFTNTVWWRNLRGGAPVTLRLAGRDRAGFAEAIEDPEMVAEGLLAMASQSPGASRRGYYAIPRTADGQPDRPALLAMARTRVLIRVRLADGPAG